MQKTPSGTVVLRYVRTNTQTHAQMHMLCVCVAQYSNATQVSYKLKAALQQFLHGARQRETSQLRNQRQSHVLKNTQGL